jgi:hypothetical protein
MKRTVFVLTLLWLVFTTAGHALAQTQSGAAQLANQSRISVLSKAGTPVPRPSVPVRYVPMPEGAERGTAYYYGWYNGGGYGYSGNSYASSSADSDKLKKSSIPGLVTRPRSSYSKGFRR